MMLPARLRRTILAALLILSILPISAAAAAPEEAPPDGTIEGGRLVLPGKGPAFLMAVNYEGPADRAWQMWEDGQFDAGLIEADLRRAKDSGFSAVRVFVQPPLAKEVLTNKWDKMDSFFAIAQRQGLFVILSLYDYGERDLAKVADVDGRIAARYAKNSTLLAYDLKNEPHLSDLTAAVYPGGAQAPVQKDGGAEESIKSYQEFVAASSDWVADRKYLLSTADYVDSPDGKRWEPLLQKVSASLSMWLQPQVDALRKSDKQHPITVAYSDWTLAKMPANGTLDYITLHRYPNATKGAVEWTARAMNNLRSAFPGKPVFLGEFGFSTDGMSPEDAGNYEMAMYFQLVSEGLAGGGKWMLNDFPKGANPKQNAYGAFNSDASPKPVVLGIRGLSDYLSRSQSKSGHLYIQDKPAPGYRWAYEANDALVISSDGYKGTRLSFDAERLSQLFLVWPDPKVMRIYSTSRTELEMDPSAIVGDKMDSGYALAKLEAAGRKTATFSQNGTKLKMTLDAGCWYELALPRANTGSSVRGEDYAIANGHFYTQANGRPLGASADGFSVVDDNAAKMWTEFHRVGGTNALGYPVTQRFVLDGFITQAFQKAVLQWRPETSHVAFLNTFEVLHERGMDDWLLAYRQTPKPMDPSPDTGLAWDKVVARHLAFLDNNPAIKQKFVANPAWLDHYGLPLSYADKGTSYVIRAQRAVFQYWKEDVPWAKKGDVTIANGGDLGKEAFLWPVEAAIPQAPAPR